ncbi:MAG TPA: DUF3499 family protein, partial [Acidimicrobiia bacterium]|nr:DUF3499 family protein [Acidimicrobiia bacterium]
MSVRRCDRPDCARPASASLSYRYDERSVWVGDLVTDDAQHCLCAPHADRLRVPVGWALNDLRAVGLV